MTTILIGRLVLGLTMSSRELHSFSVVTVPGTRIARNADDAMIATKVSIREPVNASAQLDDCQSLSRSLTMLTEMWVKLVTGFREVHEYYVQACQYLTENRHLLQPIINHPWHEDAALPIILM